MIIKERFTLSPGERAMPMSKYFDLPLYEMDPMSQALAAKPMDADQALPIESWLEHLALPGEYTHQVFGYREMENADGKYGFIAAYSTYQNATPKMMSWYFNWINVHSKSQPKDTGNLRYKLWCPAGHWTHEFINGKDRADGIMTQEQLDLLQQPGTPFADQFISVRYPIDLMETDVDRKLLEELKKAGVWIDPAYIKYYKTDGSWTPILGTHLMLTMSRPILSGGMEKVSAEWIGYGLKDGKPVYDFTTPEWKVSNQWLKVGLTHGTTEAQHLAQFLPDLYNEYKDKPIDAD